MDLTPYKNCLALTNSVFVANEEKPYRPCCWFKTYIDATDIHDYRKQLAEIDLEKIVIIVFSKIREANIAIDSNSTIQKSLSLLLLSTIYAI